MSTNGGSVKAEEGVSPTNKEAMGQETPQPMASVDNSMKSLEMRADPDPDAQSTVTDFLDFTEYLPSDIIRSLTLIGKLDQSYYNASDTVHDLTSTWGQLPNLPADERPSPVRLRADISEALRRVVDSRTFSHAEAVRMSENVTRHYHRAKAILSKLETMLENYPTAEEQTSPVAVSKSPKVSKTPKVVTLGPDNKKVRRPMVPRITVPGEVLAPYDNFEPYSSDSEASSDYDEIESTRRPIPVAATPTPRIKVVRTQKTPKPPKTPKPTPSAPQLSQAPQTSQPSQPSQPFQASQPAATPIAVAASAVVAEGPTDQPPPPVKQAPPSNVVIGSAEAPWLQLTPFELARLRKRMKKNATWTPSDAMIARELNDLGRGVEAYREAKRKAEEEGRAIDPPPAAVVAESQPGSHKLPEGALSAAALSSEGVPSSNRGMKLNEAKRQKRESLAKQAAEEAEESARRFNETARKLMTPQQPTPSVPAKPNTAAQTKSTSSRNKRKRHSIAEGEDLKPDTTDTSAVRPPLKRTKTETPVPLPQLRGSVGSQPLTETPIPPPVLTPNGSTTTPQSSTPVPIPVPGQDALKRTMSPAASNTMTIAVPSKSPAETPVAPPSVSPRKSTTPILPPVREPSKRETRGDVAKKTQQQQQLKQQAEGRQSGAAVDAHAQAQQDQARSSTAPSGKHAASRSSTPSMLPGSDEVTTRTRPSSRGKAPSQEPQTSLAADRPRRSSTARNTPAPEAPAASSRRTRRPAPGVVSTTSSGGSSAVGRRKKAPSVKRRVRSQKKDNGQTVEEMEEVDDEGNSIDPNEPRYCVCNRVSFGTMISCDNASCPMEWFHLECVGLSGIPPRTTKWYCPDCRVALNIGERGEVNARGVKT